MTILLLVQVLSEWSEGRVAWDVAVSSLGAVIASTSRPWSQHGGALTALLALGTSRSHNLDTSYDLCLNVMKKIDIMQ